MKLPLLSAKEVVKFLAKNGFGFEGQVGSHMKLKDEKGHVVTVPAYSEIPVSVLLNILKQAGLKREDLEKYLRG